MVSTDSDDGDDDPKNIDDKIHQCILSFDTIVVIRPDD